MNLYLIKRAGFTAIGDVEAVVVNADDSDHALAVSTSAFPDTPVGQLERREWSTRSVRDVEYIGEARPADRSAGVLVVSRKVVTE